MSLREPGGAGGHLPVLGPHLVHAPHFLRALRLTLCLTFLHPLFSFRVHVLHGPDLVVFLHPVLLFILVVLVHFLLRLLLAPLGLVLLLLLLALRAMDIG